MFDVNVNYVAVLLAAVAPMIIGGLWYSPLLFANQWIKLMGYSKKDLDAIQSNASVAYAKSFIASIITAYVFAHFVSYLDVTDVSMGAQLGFWIWLGFAMPVQLTALLFEGKKAGLFYIGTAYQLVSLVTMGAILAYFV